MSLAIGHKEGNGPILDAVRERRPPFSPEDVVSEFAELAQQLSDRNGAGRPLRRGVAARAFSANTASSTSQPRSPRATFIATCCLP